MLGVELPELEVLEALYHNKTKMVCYPSRMKITALRRTAAKTAK